MYFIKYKRGNSNNTELNLKIATDLHGARTSSKILGTVCQVGKS